MSGLCLVESWGGGGIRENADNPLWYIIWGVRGSVSVRGGGGGGGGKGGSTVPPSLPPQPYTQMSSLMDRCHCGRQELKGGSLPSRPYSDI